MFIFVIAFLGLFLLELIYFKIADHFNIIDKPNERSSHSILTIRGGGVIFPLALVLGIFIDQPHQYLLAIGIFAIASISFLDDILTLNNKLRIGIHFISVLFILTQIFLNQNMLISSPFSLVSFILILTSFVIIIGIINAYNFMDGINGMTVLYSSVTLISFWFIQHQLNIPLLNENILLLLLASLVVFGFFNLRKKAKTFAGDVGSISMALLFCFLLITLMVETANLKWILLLGIYGLDAVATITCRIIRKENIFEAHRSHFYQYLANELKWNHLLISIVYSVIQLMLNLTLIYFSIYIAIPIFIFIILLYITLRLKLEGFRKLFSSKMISSD
ncbi:MAG: glycosyl transferase family 4 [Bacteroidetes bacterium]|nr:glycosyl transferase family 4 [Bacteroidota bacterium]